MHSPESRIKTHLLRGLDFYFLFYNIKSDLNKMKKIALLTSGGDSPGMNPCIRAIVRKAIWEKLEVVGIRRGFAGLMVGDFVNLKASSVSGIIHQGGTILKTARSPLFKTEEGQIKALENLKRFNIEGLIVIGGDGSLRGAYALNKRGIPTIGIPASIDNDIPGSDFSIGFFTAINTALEAIDKIRDTATSHERLFIIEVMGRTSGFIALWAGLAGGAEDIFIPEKTLNLEEVCQRLEEGRRRGKTSSIIVTAEGDRSGRAFQIGEEIKKRVNYEVRVIVLGHIQRGGSPVALDRIISSRLGVAAVDALIKGERGKMVGICCEGIKIIPLQIIWKERKKINLDLYNLNQILAT